jgi:hypothetical protein
LRFSPLSQAQNLAEIVHDRLEAARREPTPGLPIDGSSRRQVMRQHHPQGSPVRTNQRKQLTISRRSCWRWGAAAFIKVK